MSVNNSALVLQEQPSYMNFINSLKSPETKEQYRRELINFIDHYNVSLDGLLSLPPKEIEQLIIKYITNMNAKGLSHSYINLVMCAIFHFLDMNDALLNKRKISKFSGEAKKMNQDRAYTHDEIKQLVDTGDFRFRAIVLFLASYKQRKSKTLSEDSTQLWLNHFTRIGFVKHHKEQLECIQRLQDDSLRQFFTGCIKTPRNEDKILKLKQDIRDNTKLLSELGLGTPIISAIKAKLEENAKTIQVCE